MTDPIAAALAELRAIPTRTAAPEEPPTNPDCPHHCTGDRRGYQWHQRSENLPACDASREAAAAYGRDYLPAWRRKQRVHGRPRHSRAAEVSK